MDLKPGDLIRLRFDMIYSGLNDDKIYVQSYERYMSWKRKIKEGKFSLANTDFGLVSLKKKQVEKPLMFLRFFKIKNPNYRLHTNVPKTKEKVLFLLDGKMYFVNSDCVLKYNEKELEDMLQS